jgi:porphyrinogen peroxidase
MPTPQTGIFTEGSSHHYYLEYTLTANTTADQIRKALMVVVSGKSSVAAGVNMVIGFGPGLWAQLSPEETLNDFMDFEAIEGLADYRIPATQRDLFFWLHGSNLDDTFDRALEVQSVLKPLAELALDERGFTYHDSRDLTGFIDGSANPKDDDARLAALVPGGEVGAGGAFVLSQKWVHDLEAFHALPDCEQEAIIGRTKPDSIELEGDAMPPDSHVSRTDVTEDGVAMKIYRRSAPFGSVSEKGLYFLSFSCAVHRFDVQLRRMFGVSGDGLHDRIVEFSKPVTSSYWFAPSKESLAAIF